jgi:dipeptidyl aminopeptidase/acylaminoacyl peptidase
LDYLLATYKFLDKARVGAAGASYGGYLINWIEGQTSRFACLVSHDGVFDLRSMWGATEELWFPEWEQLGPPWAQPEQYSKWSPSYYVKNFKTPMLVVHSQNDFRVTLDQGLQLFTSLQRMNVPSKLLYFPDEDHFVSKPQNAELWWKTVLDWLSGYLKK